MTTQNSNGVYFPFQYTLHKAYFIRRPNRFLAHLEVNGEEVRAHVPDPGRLKELLVPGAEVRVRHNPSPTRKTDWTLTLVKKDDVWVCVNTQVPNALVGEMLRSGSLEEFKNYGIVESEVTHQNSRIDFRLENEQGYYWLEAKSVSLVHEGVGLFPDAPTTRGARHLRHLMDLKKQGNRAGVLFLVQRSDARLFAPNWITDEEFSKTLKAANENGVEITVYTTHVEPDGIRWGKRIDFDLEHKYPLPSI